MIKEHILLLVGELSFDDSHDLFRGAFTLGFPWEVLKVVADFIISIIITMNTMMKVFSGPPNVVFTWRHWGHLEGSFQDNQVGGILHHVASKSNLKSAHAKRFFYSEWKLQQLTPRTWFSYSH